MPVGPDSTPFLHQDRSAVERKDFAILGRIVEEIDRILLTGNFRQIQDLKTWTRHLHFHVELKDDISLADRGTHEIALFMQAIEQIYARKGWTAVSLYENVKILWIVMVAPLPDRYPPEPPFVLPKPD